MCGSVLGTQTPPSPRTGGKRRSFTTSGKRGPTTRAPCQGVQMANYDDLDQFLNERVKWLKIRVAENEHGTFDVVLNLDGSYGAKATAEDQADFLREEVSVLLKKRGIQASL